MLQVKQIQPLAKSVPDRTIDLQPPPARARRCRGDVFLSPNDRKRTVGVVPERTTHRLPILGQEQQANEIDPLYLFACHIEWERKEDPSAGWELIAASRSSNCDARAHARTLLSSSRHLGGWGLGSVPDGSISKKRRAAAEGEMKGPYGLEITDNCQQCTSLSRGFFCEFSDPVLQSLDRVSHKTVLPAGAILFVEGRLRGGCSWYVPAA